MSTVNIMPDFDLKVSALCNSVQIDYGIINGKFNQESSHIIVFIKAGLTGSIYGYENKYLKMARNLFEQYPVIQKALLIGAPLNDRPDLIQKALVNFKGEKLYLVCGNKDPCFGLFKLYSELESEKVIFTAYMKVDHVFSGNTELFIKLPEKYLFTI